MAASFVPPRNPKTQKKLQKNALHILSAFFISHMYDIIRQHGAVAEWLRRGLQNLVHRFNSGRRLHKEARSPLGTRRAERSEARMAELVYAFDLKSNGEIRTGSSPVSATKI